MHPLHNHKLVRIGCIAALLAFRAPAANMVLHGVVTMEDGSIPPRPVTIQRYCGDSVRFLATTNAKGIYRYPVAADVTSLQLTVSMAGVGGGTRQDLLPGSSCVIRASLPGYQSNFIDIGDVTSFSDPLLPTLVLARRGTQPDFETFAETVPSKAKGRWDRAGKAVHEKNWVEAETQLRAVVQSSPRFAPGWQALGDVFQYQQKSKEAEDSYRRAADLNPKLMVPYLMLAKLKIAEEDWPGTEAAADALIKEDRRHQYPEAYVYKAIARYHLKDVDGAETIARQAIEFDRHHDVPTAEYVLGLILEAKKEYSGAGEYLSRYLESAPHSPDAEAVRSRIENLGKPEAAAIGPALESVAHLDLERAAVAWVPGGVKALAAVAHLPSVPQPQNFFTEYFRAIAREVSFGTSKGVPQYLETIQTYMTSISELALLGEHRDNATLLRLSTREPQRELTARVLALLGWRLTVAGNAVRVELGHLPEDGLKQPVLGALGVDAIDMQRALEAGETFQFEVPTEEARLSGGEAWAGLLNDKAIAKPGASKDGIIAGGIAGAFANDARLAQAYAGLASMSPEAASALVEGVGLRALVTRYPDATFRYGGSFVMHENKVAVPGGAETKPAWQKLTGVSPDSAPAFLRALLEKDQHKPAAFYFAVSEGDEAHRKFFGAHAATFYAWYRDSAEFRNGVGKQAPGWPTRLFRELPLDDRGRVRFPGGRRAWTTAADAPGSEAELLVSLDSLEALVPIAHLEDRRKAPLDEDSVKLLIEHFAAWHPLFPDFEKLPGLKGEDFAALAEFADAVEKIPSPAKNLILGEWNSLMELTIRANLDSAAGTRAFRRICDGLRGPDHSARASELLREIAGGGSDNDLPARLLHLSADRREAFNRVMQLLNVPSLDAAAKDPSKLLPALSGLVYASSLDPAGLLVNEDPKLVERHRFAGDSLFQDAALVRPGGYFSGGFVNFDQAASALVSGGRFAPLLVTAAAAPDPSAPAQTDSTSSDVVFRAEGRLVEVFASVTDGAGHPIDDLTRDQFTLIDRGAAQKIVAFEPRSSDVSVALLLDTTGSMQPSLPVLKNAALRLIDDLRPMDSVAIYGFSDTLTELQPFTRDKSAAKRAVLKPQAYGQTALYDALTRVGRDLAGRGGKKVIVVFTDGNDNWSTVSTETAVLRAKAAGVPVYTIAQGEGLNSDFLKQLATVSKATGGVSFTIHQPSEIRGVFEKVSADVTHGYLLVFAPAPADDHTWRPIELELRGSKSYKIRAREGYYPE